MIRDPSANHDTILVDGQSLVQLRHFRSVAGLDAAALRAHRVCDVGDLREVGQCVLIDWWKERSSPQPDWCIRIRAMPSERLFVCILGSALWAGCASHIACVSADAPEARDFVFTMGLLDIVPQAWGVWLVSATRICAASASGLLIADHFVDCAVSWRTRERCIDVTTEAGIQVELSLTGNT